MPLGHGDSSEGFDLFWSGHTALREASRLGPTVTYKVRQIYRACWPLQFLDDTFRLLSPAQLN